MQIFQKYFIFILKFMKNYLNCQMNPNTIKVNQKSSLKIKKKKKRKSNVALRI